MLWFWFTIGLIITILGAFVVSSDEDVEINGYIFDAETLGTCMLTMGGLLAGAMLVALGIHWMMTQC